MSTVPINNKKPFNSYVATAGQIVFTFDWYVFKKEYIQVYKNNILLSYLIDYTVQFTGQTEGGTITLKIPAELNDKIVLRRKSEIKRTSGYTESGEFRANAVNLDLNYLITILQEQGFEAERSFKLYATDDDVGEITIPDKISRAGKIFAFDNDGKPTVITITPEGFLTTIEVDDTYTSSTVKTWSINKLLSEFVRKAEAVDRVIDTVGDLIVGDTNGNPAKLAKGADNTILVPTATGLEWKTLSFLLKNILTSEGDLISRDENSNIVRIPAGTEGQALVIENGKPKWKSTDIGDFRTGTTVSKLKTGLMSREHMAFLMKDKTIKTCGVGDYAGNGDIASNTILTPRNLPVLNPPAGGFKEVYLGINCWYAIGEDGYPYFGGQNGDGNGGLGHNTNVGVGRIIQWFVDNNITVEKIFTPQATGGTEGMVVFFLGTNKRLYSCGYNTWGQLGVGDKTARNIPTRVGSLENVVDVVIASAYATTVYVITDDGTQRLGYTFGWNGRGQQGLGASTSDVVSPTLIAGFTDIKKFAATGGLDTSNSQTYTNAFMLRMNGDLYFAGTNAYGCGGLGNDLPVNVWTQVPNQANVKDIVIGGGLYATSALIDENNNLQLSGYNGYGQTARGNTNLQTTFQLPSGGDEAIFQTKILKVIIAGDYSYSGVLVLSTEGEVCGVGYGYYGQLARDTFTSTAAHHYFKKLIGAKNPWESRKAIDIGVTGHSSYWTTYVHYTDGLVRSCGRNEYGQSGIGYHPGNGIYPKQLVDVRF